MAAARTMYGIVDTESGELVLIPDGDDYLRSLLPLREQVEFLAGQGSELVKVTIETIAQEDTSQYPSPPQLAAPSDS